MECVEFKAVLSIKERDKYKCKKMYVLLIFVKYVQRGLRTTKIQKEDSNKTNYKKKAIMEQACQVISFLHPEELKGHPV